LYHWAFGGKRVKKNQEVCLCLSWCV
jgi:hypothetical protein